MRHGCSSSFSEPRGAALPFLLATGVLLAGCQTAPAPGTQPAFLQVRSPAVAVSHPCRRRLDEIEAPHPRVAHAALPQKVPMTDSGVGHVRGTHELMAVIGQSAIDPALMSKPLLPDLSQPPDPAYFAYLNSRFAEERMQIAGYRPTGRHDGRSTAPRTRTAR